MSLHSHVARDDLAFMRALVDNGAGNQAMAGRLFLSGGLIYGAQCLAEWAGMVGLLQLSGPQHMLIALGATGLFLIALSWALWRGQGFPSGGATSRAIGAAFAVLGSTNLVMLWTFASAAVRLHIPMIWEIYPVVVFALQGAAWSIAFLLRKRLWQGAVAAGWFGTAVALGAFIGTTIYPLIAAIGLIGWMAFPGAVMLRLARRTA